MMASSSLRFLFLLSAGALAAGVFPRAARAGGPEPAPRACEGGTVVIVDTCPARDQPLPAPPAEPPPPLDLPADPPPPEPVAPVPPPPDLLPAPGVGRWVFEVGVFAAYLSGHMDRAELNGDPSSIALSPSTSAGTGTTDCSAVDCSYSLGPRGSLAGGVSLFAGYAAADWIHVGGRILGGPRLRGGALFATGPSVSMHMWGPLWVGASLLAGYVSQSERDGTVTPPASYTLASPERVAMTASTDLAFGAGVELRLSLFRTPTGAFSVDTQPFFLAGSPGSAFVLPIGLSYRWSR